MAPRIPVAQERSVAPRAAAPVRVSAEAPVGQVSGMVDRSVGAISSATGAIAQMADEAIKRANATAVSTAKMQILKSSTPLKRGLLGSRGVNAVGITTQYTDQVDAQYEEWTSTLSNDEQKVAVAAWFQQRTLADSVELSKHETAQGYVAQQGAHESYMQIAASEVPGSIRAGGEQAYLIQKEQVAAQILNNSMVFGKDGPTPQAELDKYSDGAARYALSELIASGDALDLERATEILADDSSAIRQDLSPKSFASLKRALKTRRDNEATAALAKGAYEEFGVSRDEAYDYIDKNSETAAEYEAAVGKYEKQIGHARTASRFAWAQQDRNAKALGYGWATDNPDEPVENMPDYARLNKVERGQAIAAAAYINSKRSSDLTRKERVAARKFKKVSSDVLLTALRAPVAQRHSLSQDEAAMATVRANLTPEDIRQFDTSMRQVSKDYLSAQKLISSQKLPGVQMIEDVFSGVTSGRPLGRAHLTTTRNNLSTSYALHLQAKFDKQFKDNPDVNVNTLMTPTEARADVLEWMSTDGAGIIKDGLGGSLEDKINSQIDAYRAQLARETE